MQVTSWWNNTLQTDILICDNQELQGFPVFCLHVHNLVRTYIYAFGLKLCAVE